VLELAADLTDKVRTAAAAKVRRYTDRQIVPKSLTADAILPLTPAHAMRSDDTIIVIGASTGGTEALKDLLSPLPADFPGIVIVQHMPEAFTRQFAARLNTLCRIRVQEARDGDRILPGHALLAPGGHHMAVVRRGMEYAVHVYRGERVNRHLPSVDVLFSSCAKQLGANALGVLLTGMGADGARGMLEMREANAATFAEDESTCVVFGMPHAAMQLGAVEQALPLHRIPGALIQRLRQAEMREGASG
jgi:two-component system chemotaxis response regulator CheB